LGVQFRRAADRCSDSGHQPDARRGFPGEAPLPIG